MNIIIHGDSNQLFVQLIHKLIDRSTTSQRMHAHRTKNNVRYISSIYQTYGTIYNTTRKKNIYIK